jgi:hypothetical protein
MTINMQGAWTLTVAAKNAALPQRFRVAGAVTGDGVYDGTVGFSVAVNGPAWGVTIESAPAGPGSWTPSHVRLADFRSEADGTFRVRLTSNDPGPDQDFDDLVIECSMVLSPSEHVVYGRVRAYDGACLFNPCYPPSFWVVESGRQLADLLKNAAARRVLERLYGETVLRSDRRQPGAERFRSLMIPTGEPEPPALVVRGARKPSIDVRQPASELGRVDLGRIDTALIANRPTIGTALPPVLRPSRPQIVEEAGKVRASAVALAKEDLLTLARLRDRLKVTCKTSPLPQTLLRVLEYDRTAAEKLGGPYSGEGPREVLGVTSTDDAGWYVFRFSRSLAAIAAESADVGSAEDPAVALRPDVIVQVLEGLPEGVVYESPAYFDVANVRRIDLCLSADLLGHTTAACQGGRAIQALGDMLLVDPATELHADGTISNSATSGPAVQHAAWRGVVDVFACFLQTPRKVRWYTVRYREHVGATASPWAWVTEPYAHPHQRADGSWESKLVGPQPGVALRVNGDGQPALEVPAYINIEEDTTWLHTHRDRKVYLNSFRYHAVAGLVEFQLQGWDADGKLVASDAVKLYLDNHRVTGAIASISHADQPYNTCALLELPSNGAALDIKLRVEETEGFLKSWSLAAYRGSNTAVSIQGQTSHAPIGDSYANVAPFRFTGTTPTADGSGYVTFTVEPIGGWLPEGRDFCAFAFELHAVERITDGKGTPGTITLWRELVGISHPS